MAISIMARANNAGCSKVSGVFKGWARYAAGVTVLAAWLLLWQGAYLLVGQDLLLASPAAVCRRVVELAVTSAFWRTVSGSLGRILLGYLSAVALGAFLAVLTARSRILYAFLALPMNIIKATPVASFVILALVWISGRRLSAFVAFLMVLPLVWRNVHEGILSTDAHLLEMARVYRLSAGKTLRAIVLPAVLPHFLSAVRLGAGFAWKAGVAGEVIAIPRAAIGTELYQAKVYLETTDLFAWTLVIILLSLLLERTAVYSVGRLACWLEGGKRC